MRPSLSYYTMPSFAKASENTRYALLYGLTVVASCVSGVMNLQVILAPIVRISL